MVSNLDAESKDPSLFFGRFFLENFLVDDVDWTRVEIIGYEGSHSAKKKSRTRAFNRKT